MCFKYAVDVFNLFPECFQTERKIDDVHVDDGQRQVSIRKRVLGDAGRFGRPQNRLQSDKTALRQRLDTTQCQYAGDLAIEPVSRCE